MLIMENIDIKYIERSIRDYRFKASHSFYASYYNEVDIEGEDHDLVVYYMQQLYHLILAYLEAKGLQKFADHFRTRFESKILNPKEIMKSTHVGEEYEPDLTMLSDFDAFLSPFKAFDKNAKSDEEINRLMDVLKSTTHIVKGMGGTITNEASIYNPVRWVIKIYYPGARKGQGKFTGVFQYYNPDILIPELKTAVEYKFIRVGESVDKYLDQIVSDAKNYDEDQRYDNFIAVVCLESAAIATEKQVRTAWVGKKFPQNWDLAVVFLS